MNSFCLMLKQFYKNWITLTVSIAFFVISFGYTIYSIVLCSQQNLNPLNYLSQTLSLSMFSFVFFLFISNEFLNRTVQNGMQAVPRTIKNSSCFFFVGFFSNGFCSGTIYATSFNNEYSHLFYFRCEKL